MPLDSTTIVIAGDGVVGKSSILSVLVNQEFPETYVPTTFENSVINSADLNLKIDNNKIIDINLWDIAGQEEYEKMRPVAYQNADVVILCFSIDSIDSLKNITSKWIPEIKYYNDSVMFLLVGTKADIRENRQLINELQEDGITIISKTAGETLAKEIGNHVAYMECSALENRGITEVFEAAVNMGLWKKYERGEGKTGCRCSIL